MSQTQPTSNAKSLPLPLTAFIGREAELAELGRLVRDPTMRLLTLTGPGGVGKSHLALEVAARYPGDVFVASLAEVRVASGVLPAIAGQLGLREDRLRRAQEHLVDALCDRATLLVLDNLEHLTATGPDLVELLQRCPQLTMLLTSRIPLRVRGERAYAVLPLTVPTLAPLPPLSELARCDAVALFVDRARAVQPDFALTAANAAAVAEICIRLDGLPLAIELAAARLKILSPDALLARLAQRLQVLTSGPRDQPVRLQTMRAAVAWSYDLLRPEEQALFRVLAIFVGGFSLDAVEAIAGDQEHQAEWRARFPASLLDGLAALVDHSLVQRADGDHDPPRFSLLEVVREFGLDCLRAAGEEATARLRHAEWAVEFVERGAAVPGRTTAEWFDRLRREEANVNLARDWMLEHGAWRLGLRLAVARYDYWLTRGASREERAWLADLIAMVPDELESARALDHARVLNLLGVLHYYVGEHDAARPWYEASLTRRRALGDRSGQADTLNNLALVALASGDPARGKELCAEAVRLMRPVGDQVQLALFLSNLADVVGALGDYDQAWRLLQTAARHLRGNDASRVRGHLLQRMGATAIARGELELAPTLLAESLAIYQRFDEGHGVALVFRHQSQLALLERRHHRAAAHVVDALNLGEVSEDPALLAGLVDQQAAIAVATGQTQRAAKLIGQADALYDLTGAVPDAFYQTERERTLATMRSKLGEEQASTLRALGGNLPLDEAVAEAVAVAEAITESGEIASDVSAAPDEVSLTRRERDVLALLAAGYTNRQIGDALFLSHRTVATHVSNLLAKLNAPTRAAAATEAVRLGLVNS